MKGEIEHLAKRCKACKHYYLSPCGDDDGRLKSCPNWNYLQSKPSVSRVMPKRGAKPNVLPDHTGPIPDKAEPLRRVGINRVQRKPSKPAVERVKLKPKVKRK